MWAIAILIAGCNSETPPGVESPAHSAETKDMAVSAYQLGIMTKVSQVRELMDAENYPDAEEIVDEEIGNSSYGVLMHEFKAALLAKRDEKSDALDKYMSLLNQDFGRWHPDPYDLGEPFDLAIELEREEDADAIAIEMLANNSESFSEFSCLQIPDSAQTGSERLAYAFLLRAFAATFDSDEGSAVEFCEKAKELRPNDPKVLIHLAFAYRNRGNTGDRELSRSQLSSAYSGAPGGSEVRSAAQNFAHRFGMGELP